MVTIKDGKEKKEITEEQLEEMKKDPKVKLKEQKDGSVKILKRLEG